MTKKRLPAEVRRHLDVLEDALQRTIDGAPTGETVDDIDQAVENAYTEALRRAASTRPPESAYITVSFQSMIADRLRLIREESGWTQATLAEAMSALGFDWKRITVAEIERRSDDPEKPPRRVALEELVALAGLYGVPVWDLLVPGDGEYLRMPDGRTLTPGTVRELFFGDNGFAGTGGAEWGPASTVALDIRRPATDLWERRGAGYGKGLRARRGD